MLAVVLAAGACGGGGDSSEPIVAPHPETVGTLSEESRQNALIQDVTSIRGALESGQADEAITGIYDLLNEAGDLEALAGGALIREKLPPLVAMLDRSAPSVRERVKSVETQTRASRAVRRIALSVLASQMRDFNYLAREVRRSGRYTWRAVERWGRRTEATRQGFDAELVALRRQLEPSDRAALDRAIQEVYGNSPGP